MDHSNSSHCCLARLSCDDVKAEIKGCDVRKRKSHKKGTTFISINVQSSKVT